MMRYAAIALAVVFSLSARSAYAVNRFGVGLRMGFAPNQFSELNQGDRDSGDSNDRIHNRFETIKSFYTNGTSYNQAPVVRDFKFTNDTNPAVTVGFDLRYLWKDFMFQVGFSHFIVSDTRKSYFSVLGDQSTRSNNTTVSAYDDINENYDKDNVYVPEAVGLYPTGGAQLRYTEFTQARRIDIPLSVALHLTLAQKYHFFIGGGLSYHWGRSERIIDASPTQAGVPGPDIQPDIDVFEGNSIGLFYFLTSEYRLTDRLAMYTTVKMTYGESKLTRDKVITGKGTINSLFHANDENDEGGPEKSVDETVSTGAGFQRFAQLSFSGIQMNFGIMYYLTEFK